jgi:hypothetical protein
MRGQECGRLWPHASPPAFLDFRAGYDEWRHVGKFDFEVGRVDRDGLHEFFGPRAAFVQGRGLPQGGGVGAEEQVEHGVHAAGRLGPGSCLSDGLFALGSERVELGGHGGLLFAVQVVGNVAFDERGQHPASCGLHAGDFGVDAGKGVGGSGLRGCWRVRLRGLAGRLGGLRRARVLPERAAGRLRLRLPT